VKNSLMVGVALSLMAGSAQAHDGKHTYIHAGTLLAVPGQAAQTDQTIVVADGKIQEVLDGFYQDDEGVVIDLSA